MDMEFPKKGKPGGKERKVLTRQEAFEKLCGLLCNEHEIASFLNITPTTLRKWVKDTYEVKNYTEAVDKLKDKGRIELRQNLFIQSRKNPAVAIFLAKNYLGMSDNPQPVENGEKRKEFENAIKLASKALERIDVSEIDIPHRRTAEEIRRAVDGDEE